MEEKRQWWWGQKDMKRRERAGWGERKWWETAGMLWDEGLSYPLKHICVCSCQKDVVYEIEVFALVDVGVCTRTLRWYREVAAATAMEWVSVWEQEEAGRIWFLLPSSRRAGSFCARAKWSNVLFISNVSAPRFDLTTRCKNAVCLYE